MSSLSTDGQPAATRASVSSLYVLKALLAFFVVTCHAPILLPWVEIPGLTTELFFTITGYFLGGFREGTVAYLEVNQEGHPHHDLPPAFVSPIGTARLEVAYRTL